jgi:hypothetical protein
VPIDGLLLAKLSIVGFAVVVQTALIFKNPLVGLASTPAECDWSQSRALTAIENFAHAFAGVCSHGVFLDAHFEGYDRVVAVTYLDSEGKETWLPFTNERGRPGPFARGRLWAKWMFRANGPTIHLTAFTYDLRLVTAFWARREGVDLNDAEFRVIVKKFDRVEEWSPGVLKRQVRQPWQEAGHLYWKNNQFTTTLSDIEQM